MSTTFITQIKKINYDFGPLFDRNENAFRILGTFQKVARSEDWTQSEIQAVLEEATSGNYNKLMEVMFKYSFYHEKKQKNQSKTVKRTGSSKKQKEENN